MYTQSLKSEVKTDKQSRSRDLMPKTAAVHVPAKDAHARIAEAAYYAAERRGFAPGSELEDWFAAEREFDGRPVQNS